MGKLLHKLWWIIWDSDLSFIELLLSIFYIWWAVVLLVVRPDLFSSNVAYKPLEEQASQMVWGVSFLGIGVLMLISLLTTTYWARAISALAGLMAWSFVAAAFLFSGVGTGVGTYIFFACACLLILLRQVRLQSNMAIKV